jgi:6,7-dimethyl-8-ribityllumazine synthase
MTSFEGQLNGAGLRVAIAASRFNELIVERLLSGATDGLLRHGVSPDAIDVACNASPRPAATTPLSRSGR